MDNRRVAFRQHARSRINSQAAIRNLNAFHLQMAGLRANAYYEFVPSLANLADLPSRNEFELLEQLGGRRVDVVFPPAADWLGPLRRWFTRFAEQ